MTTTTHGAFQGCVVLEDEAGQGEVPLSRLVMYRRAAEHAPNDRAIVGGRSWHRDSLKAAEKTWRELGLVELPQCAGCHDEAGTQPMGDGRAMCVTCCSAAQGSIHDDRTEF